MNRFEIAVLAFAAGMFFGWLVLFALCHIENG